MAFLGHNPQQRSAGSCSVGTDDEVHAAGRGLRHTAQPKSRQRCAIEARAVADDDAQPTRGHVDGTHVGAAAERFKNRGCIPVHGAAVTGGTCATGAVVTSGRGRCSAARISPASWSAWVPTTTCSACSAGRTRPRAPSRSSNRGSTDA